MPEDTNIWDKFSQRRLSRRRLLSTTALVGTGLGAAAVVGCGSDSTSNPQGTGSTDTTGLSEGEIFLRTPFETPVDGRKTFTPAPTGSRGDILTYIGFDAVVLDRYDPHQTQFGPMYSNQSAVFSKLYRYASHEEPTWDNILPDLATSAPEMVEPSAELLTYIIHLRQGVTFHDTDKIRGDFPGLAGRELTADDVKYSYDRQRNHDSAQLPYYYRSSQYETIDTLDVVDKYTLRIKTKEPTAPFYHFMADTNAMIIPQEIVDESPGSDGRPWDSVDAQGRPKIPPEQRMIGTGPFIWDHLTFGIEFEAKRNPAWFGWDDKSLGRPYLAGYKATGQGLNDGTVESLFRRKEVDTAGFIDNPEWILKIMDEQPELVFQRQQVSGWLNSRLKTYAAPFNDWRVRRALHLAVDRQDIIDIIGSGAWYKVGPVNSAIKYWALPDDQLLALPGYRVNDADRAADITEARQLYEAAGKPEIPQIWFANVPGYIGAFATTYINTIKANLGITSEVRYQQVSYGRIAEGLARPESDLGAFTWGYDNGWIDLDDWVYPYFKTKGPKNSFQVSDPALDVLLDKQRKEFDTDARKLIGYDIQKHLLGEADPQAPAANARLDYACPGGGSVRWPYYKNDSSWPWFGNQYWAAEVWFDKSDPSYAGRPQS